MVVTVLRTLQRAMPLLLLCLMLLASTCHGDIDPPPKTAAPPASSDDAPRTVVAAVRAAIAQGRSEFTAGNTSAAERTLLAAGAALSWADQMAHPALTVVLFSELASLYTRQNDEDRAWFALQHALQGMTNTVDSDIAVLRGLAYTSEVVQAMIRLHATLGNQRRRAFSLRHFGTAGPPAWPHAGARADTSAEIPRPRIAIVTICANYDPAVTPLTSLSAANKFAYAQAHGYELHFESTTRAASRAPAWSKLLAVRAHLRGGDWVAWVDCDSFFTNGARRLEELLPAALEPVLHAALPHVDLVISEDGAMVNTGVFLLRNSNWSLTLLDVLYGDDQRSPFVASPMWEQAALHALLVAGHAAALFSGLPATPEAAAADAAREAESAALWRGLDKSVLEHVLLVPQRWINAYPRALAEMVYGEDGVLAHAPHTPGDFVVSMSGCRPVLGQRACNTMFREYAAAAAAAAGVTPPRGFGSGDAACLMRAAVAEDGSIVASSSAPAAAPP